MSDITTRVRREPPRFRRARVASLEDLTPHLRRVVLEGAELVGIDPGLPGASVRLLLPDAPGGPLTMPTWSGNDFRAADGSKAVIRTLTPVAPDPDVGRLTLDVVRHGAGPLTAWIDAVGVGGEVAVSGTGRGYEVPAEARGFVLAGDESAVPALRQVLAALPPEVPVRVLVEARSADAEVDLTEGRGRPGAEVRWLVAEGDAPPGAALVAAVVAAAVEDRTHLWAAGEAAAVQRIRKHLFDERGLPRSQAHVRGYWKVGRGET